MAGHYTDDGYVKYAAEHTIAGAKEPPGWAALNEARTRLHQLGLVGVNPQGVGFGNISIRFCKDEFLISGTATGALPVLKPDGYCLVRSFDLEKNRVITEGPIQASSESMTHGIVYRACQSVNCVIHIHSRAIFDGMALDNCPSTPAAAKYGTPEIALAVEKAVLEQGSEGQIVMLGHDEGVICYGATAEKALALALELYGRYGTECCKNRQEPGRRI